MKKEEGHKAWATRPGCLAKANNVFLSCVKGAGVAVGGAVLTCVGACGFTGPFFPKCALACFEGADYAMQAVILACGVGWVGVYADCRNSLPAGCP
jgi:hypothetical protein